MLTRNFFSCFVRGKNDSEGLPSMSNIADTPSLYRRYINPEGKIFVYDTPDSTQTKYVEGIYQSNVNGAFSLSMSYSGSNRTITDNNILSIDKNDNGDTDLGSIIRSTSGGVPHIFFGSGTTTPVYNDYKLENCITTYNRNKIIVQVDHELQTITSSLVFTPTSNMTVSEIGLYMSGYGSSPNDYSGKTVKNLLAMVGRTVLSSPVTFNAGTTYTIDYTIDFKNMTDSVGGV